MKKRHVIIFSIFCLSAIAACRQEYRPDTSTVVSPGGTDIFRPDSASIAENYAIPDWFRDSKFGIFVHWGPMSVSEYGDWYARRMYDTTTAAHAYHVKTYGPVDKFGFKDFIPMFTADKFDPEQWLDLFVESGAKYVVPVAEHHDGYAMYHSTFNEWNAVDMTPHRDIVAELRDATLAHGLHFGLSSHRAEHCWFYNVGMQIPSDVQDTTITLYGERIADPDGDPFDPAYVHNPGSDSHSRANWLTHVYELVDQYHPELLYFDWTVGKAPFQETFYRFMAYYYNSAVDWGKEVVVNTKFGYGNNIQVTDFERGKSDVLREYPWQTCTSLGDGFWSYDKTNTVLKTPDRIVDDLADIVSKNGNLLLNVAPRADGSIPQEQADVLKEIGGWLSVNGEAIYSTRPWHVYGEGPTGNAAGHHSEKAISYTSEDIRFTSRGDAIYAIGLEWPEDGEVVITSLRSGNPYHRMVSRVSLLGCDEPLEWSVSDRGLVVSLPDNVSEPYAYVLKIN